MRLSVVATLAWVMAVGGVAAPAQARIGSPINMTPAGRVVF